MTRLSRRTVLGTALGLGAGLLTGCGSLAVGAAEQSSGQTRRITHRFGTVDIPLDPQRLIALDARSALEVVLALGLSPIAVDRNVMRDGAVGPWLEWDPTGVELVDSGGTINLEQLAALRPDVIVSYDNSVEDFATELGVIAPLVPVDRNEAWRTELRLVGGWFGREQQAEDAIARYEREYDDVRQRHAERIDTAQVAVILHSEDGFSGAHTTDKATSVPMKTLVDLGGRQIPFIEQLPPNNETGSVRFSNERVGDLADADAIMVILHRSAGYDLSAVEGNPLWPRLAAVAAGRVVITDWRVNTGNVYSARECLRLFDELYATLE